MKILLTNRYYDQYKQITGLRRPMYIYIKYYVFHYILKMIKKQLKNLNLSKKIINMRVLRKQILRIIEIEILPLFCKIHQYSYNNSSLYKIISSIRYSFVDIPILNTISYGCDKIMDSNEDFIRKSLQNNYVIVDRMNDERYFYEYSAHLYDYIDDINEPYNIQFILFTFFNKHGHKLMN